MRRLYPINWIQWLTLLLALVTAAAFIVLYLRIQHVQHHQNDALHSIICHAESFVRSSKTLTWEQKRQSLHFYETSLSDANLKPCQ